MKCWLIAVLAFGALAAGASVAATYPVKLSAEDRELVAAAACTAAGARGAEHIEATTAKRGSTNVDATVQCRSHRREAAVPVAHHANCHNRAGKWSCDKGYDSLQVTIRDKTVIAVVARGIQPAAAVDAVTRASKMKYPPFSELAWPIFTGTCSVSVVPSPGREGLTRFAIDCTGGKVEMNRLCWKEGCRHFIVTGERAMP